MTINQKIEGVVSLASNSPGIPTGYGQQALYLANNLLKAGVKVASLSNYGQEGNLTKLKLKNGTIPHYPRSVQTFSADMLPINHYHFRRKFLDLPNAIFILYDAWVYNGYPELDNENIVIWVPIDHITMPPAVASFLQKPNVTVISMAPDGHEQLNLAQIENTYIPHTIDTTVYKPTLEIEGKPAREWLGITDDEFLVGMVAANKANGIVHRKAFAENILAFSVFQKKHPNARLYIHSEPSKAMGGFNLVALLKACGIPPQTVIFPDIIDYRFGLDQKKMAAIYSAFDVLLAPSYGEGFGVPTMEAQACGTRVIASSWTASKDLVSTDSWLVDGMPFWDEPQLAWFKIPYVDSIISALELSYEAPRGTNQTSIDFAANFEDSKIWREKWTPFWVDYFAKQSNSSSSK